MKKSGKNRSFWKIYGIALGAALALVLVFFAVFFDIMRNYEKSQPISGAEAFADSVTAEDLEGLIGKVIADGVSPYEDEDEVIRAIRDMITADSLVCVKDFSAYTSERPVFTVNCGDVPVYRVTLEAGEKIGYGFTSWKIVSTEEVLSYEGLSVNKMNIYIPEGATLYVNGIKVESEPDGASPYKYASKWESGGKLKSDIYRINLICDAEFSAALSEIHCEMKKDGGSIYFLYPDELLLSYTVEAPEGAAVKVNGVELTADDITESGSSYTAHKVEADRGGIPTTVIYSIVGLTTAPQIKAEMAGESLTLTREDDRFTVGYPAGQSYTCTVRVPGGAEVTVNGIKLSPEDISSSESESVELFAYVKNVPSYDVYSIPMLFFEPESVFVTYNGVELPLNESADGRALYYSATYPKISSPESETLALEFLKVYFFYTSNGYINTSANLAEVLKYIPYGCELYRKMVQSEDGFSWTSPVTAMNYDTLELTSVFGYPENLRLCEIDFAVSQSFYGGIHREYKGIMKILVTADGKVVGMEIDADLDA